MDERSGWYFGAKAGLYNWAIAEDFDDRNGNGTWDPGEPFEDEDGDQQWDGPELTKELYNRDGSYWLEPEMYEDFEPFFDYESVILDWQNTPGYFFEPTNVGFLGNFFGEDVPNPYYFMPDPFTNVAWDEGRTFGGHDTFYANSTSITDEIRFVVTSQISENLKLRVGVDYKSHTLNF